MTGAHRRPEDRSVLASVRWLLALVGYIALAVAIVGVPIYLGVTDSKFLPIATLALQAFVVVTYARRLAFKVLRNRAPSPVILADWVSDAALTVAWFGSIAANIGEQQGWMHGAYKYGLFGILGLLAVAMPLYWWRGQQRLILALTARAVGGRWPWSAG